MSTIEESNDMNFHTTVRVLDDLKVISLSETEWRVSDATCDECDGLGLLGFVERVGDSYEVTRLGHPHERTSLPSLRRALDELTPPKRASRSDSGIKREHHVR